MRFTTLTAILALSATGVWADVPKVAVDIAPVHSIVAAVMDGVGTPDLIVSPGASPHGYSLRPSEARALDEADLVIWMGEGLTPWMEGPLESLAANAAKIELLEHPDTQLLAVREGPAFGHADHDDHGHDDHEDHDHAKEEEHAEHDDHDHTKEEEHADHGHDDDHAKEEEHADHGHDDDHAKEEEHADHDTDDHDEHAHGTADGMDAHAWLDPQNAIAWANAFAVTLSELDPENAATYQSNAIAFSSEINVMSTEVQAMVEPVRGKSFVVFHDAYHYFEHRFGIEALGSIKSSDASDASPATLAALRDEVADAGAVCVLTEPQFNPGIVEALGASKLGELDPQGAGLEPGPGLYPALIRSMGKTLAECLG